MKVQRGENTTARQTRCLLGRCVAVVLQNNNNDPAAFDNVTLTCLEHRYFTVKTISDTTHSSTVSAQPKKIEAFLLCLPSTDGSPLAAPSPKPRHCGAWLSSRLSSPYTHTIFSMEQPPVQIGQFILGKNLGIGAFGKVRL